MIWRRLMTSWIWQRRLRGRNAGVGDVLGLVAADGLQRLRGRVGLLDHGMVVRASSDAPAEVTSR